MFMRGIKKLIFGILYFSGVSTVYRLLTKHRARILCYHRISESPCDPLLDVSLPAFRAQIEYLANAYRPSRVDRIAQHLKAQKKFKPGMVGITFDDGTSDWVTRALPVLERFRVPATFYVCTGYIGKGPIPYPNQHTPATGLTLEEIKMLSHSPMAHIGVHTVSHPHLAEIIPHKMHEEIQQSKAILMEWLGQPSTHLAYPFGNLKDYNETTKAVAAASGMDSAVSLEERTIAMDEDPYEIPRMVVFDEPLWMFKVRVSGIIDDGLWWIYRLWCGIRRRSPHRAASWYEVPATIDASARACASSPVVSVLIRAKNVSAYLADAIESVLKQSYKSWEAIILDDASTDATPTIAEQYQQRDPRLRYIRTSRSFGRSEIANLGLKLARAPYIAILDGDDFWNDPHKLAEEVEIITKNPRAVIVSGGYARVNVDRTQLIGNFVYDLSTDQAVKERLLIENVIPHSGVLYRKDIAMRCGGYRKEWQFTEDYELWLRLGLHGTIILLPKVGCVHRFHEQNISILKRRSQTIEELRLIFHYRAYYRNIIRACIARIRSFIASFLPRAVKRWLKEKMGNTQSSIEELGAIASTVMGNAALPTYTIRRVHRFEDLSDAQRHDWETLLQETEGSIFQSLRWTETWWRHFGATLRLCLLLAYDDDQKLCAIFPGMIVKQRLLATKMRLLTFIGAPYNDINEIPCRTGNEGAITALLDACGRQYAEEWDVLHFPEVPQYAPLVSVFNEHALGETMYYHQSNERPLYDKGGTAAASADIFAKQDLRQRMNKLKRAYTPSYNATVRHEELRTAIPQWFAMHDARARHTAFASPLRDQTLRAFMTDLLTQPHENPYRASLAVLRADDTAIAYACILHAPDRQTYYLNAFDPAFHQFSPAGILLQETLKQYHASPQETFDFGRGAWPYKMRFANAMGYNINISATVRYPMIIRLKRAYTALKRFIKRSETLKNLYEKIKKWLQERHPVYSS